MQVKALGIFLSGNQRIGVLFRYELASDTVTTRFVADEAFVALADPPTLSASYLADSPAEQQAFWRDVRSVSLNGRFSNRNGWLLPAFFQNLLPEGVFRDHVAALRGCDRNDHFEMLAACGGDLPGAIRALPVELSRGELTRYVTQNNDALEMSVTAAPLDGGVSLSGVQPKVGVVKESGRYVGRTKDHDTHIIAKLPVMAQPLLPEVEELSLRLACAAGVDACKAYLEPLEKLVVQHSYDLGDADSKTQFLAVPRFDRTPGGRVHCEDFAQVLGVMPEDKYGELGKDGHTSYLDVAAVLLALTGLGEPAVHELMRRLAVNELLGNPDMHLKNLGLLYRDSKTPVLSPAYDVVAYAAYAGNRGHALALLPERYLPAMGKAVEEKPRPGQRLSPAVVRAFCGALGLSEKPARTVVEDTVKRAARQWPGMICASSLTDAQKQRLLRHFEAHPLVESLRRRAK